MTNQTYQAVDREMAARHSYDRLMEFMIHAPDSKVTRPTTIMTVLPIVGDVKTVVVRTARNKEHGFTIFLEIADASGLTRIAIPNKAAEAVYRQRQSLTDRSTPESRAKATRQRQREKQRKERAARKAAFAARNGHKFIE